MDRIVAWISGLWHSRLLRLLVVGVLASLLLIPVAAIDGLIRERTTQRDVAHNEVTATWGGPQHIAGPVLIVPYERVSQVTQKDGQVQELRRSYRLRVLPERLAIDAKVQTELRRRGMYQITLFTAATKFSGSFVRPDLSALGLAASDVHWDRAELVVELGVPRALRRQVDLNWGGQVRSFEPGAGDQRGVPGATRGIHAPVHVPAGVTRFSFELAHAGSRELRFAPVGKSNQVNVQADWPHPSFQGQWLPRTSNITSRSFQASWAVPHLGRNYPQLSHDESAPFPTLMDATLGVDLISPVDTYKMCARSVKYAGLVLLLTFLVVWVLEVLGSFRLHSIQYLLTGAGVCVFFLLQLSLAEHFGFLPAHAIASVAVVALSTAYGFVALGNWKRALVLGGVLSSVYAYLFILFQLESFALLIGACAVFAALAAVMYFTRRVQW